MRIVIVEDHEMFREALRKACAAEFGHEVVGEAVAGTEAIEVVRRQRPDLVILDLVLPEIDGLTVAVRLKKELPQTRFLMLTAHANTYAYFRMEQAGVHGCLEKSTNTFRTLQEALSEIGRGGTYFSRAFTLARRARQTDPDAFPKILSASEQRVLCLIGEGMGDDEIGKELSISPRTAQTHRHNLLQKLRLKGTPKLIAFAMQNGFRRWQG